MTGLKEKDGSNKKDELKKGLVEKEDGLKKRTG